MRRRRSGRHSDAHAGQASLDLLQNKCSRCAPTKFERHADAHAGQVLLNLLQDDEHRTWDKCRSTCSKASSVWPSDQRPRRQVPLDFAPQQVFELRADELEDNCRSTFLPTDTFSVGTFL